MAKRIKKFTRRVKRKIRRAKKHGMYAGIGFLAGLGVMYFAKPHLDALLQEWFPAPVPPAAVRFARPPMQIQAQAAPRAAVSVTNPYRTLAGTPGPSDTYSDGNLIFVD